jgi:hypothetical protein
MLIGTFMQDEALVTLTCVALAMAAVIAQISMNFQNSGRAVSVSDALRKDCRAGLVVTIAITVPVLYKARRQICVIWGRICSVV